MDRISSIEVVRQPRRRKRLLALIGTVALVLAVSCLPGDTDGDNATPTPASTEAHRTYAAQLCPAQSGDLEAGLAAIARHGEAVESDSFEVRAPAVRALVDELSELSTVFLTHLESVAPPEGDEAFIEQMRAGQRSYAEALSQAVSMAADAKTNQDLDAALEIVIASFADDLDAESALAVASVELEAALRAEPACALLL